MPLRIASVLISLLLAFGTAEAADCRMDLGAALDEFAHAHDQTLAIAKLIADLQEPPLFEVLPDVEMQVLGDTAILRPVGPARTTSYVMSTLNSLLAARIGPDGTVIGPQHASSLADEYIAARFDEWLPVDVAATFMEEYEAIRGGSLEAQAIRLQSCALYRTQQVMNFTFNRFEEAFSRVRALAAQPACSDFDIAPIRQMERKMLNAAMLSMQAGNANYTPDLSGCFADPEGAARWVRGEPRIEPQASMERTGDNGQFDRMSITERVFRRHQKKFYGVPKVYEELTWTVENARGVPDRFVANRPGVLLIKGSVRPAYNQNLRSAEGVHASLRCIGKCQFVDVNTKRSLGGWLQFRLDRFTEEFDKLVMVRSNAQPDEGFEIEFAAGGLKVIWPYTPG